MDVDPAAAASSGSGTSQPDVAIATPRPSLRLFWWVAFAVVVLDQVSKALIRARLPLYDSKAVVPGFLDLVHVHNAGVAFGLLNDVTHPLRSLATTTLAIVTPPESTTPRHGGCRRARRTLQLIGSHP